MEVNSPVLTGTLSNVPLQFASTKYYLWSTRANAWMNHGGTYTNDRHTARLFEYKEAVETCKVHRGMMGEFGLLPVAEAMLKEIKQ